MAINAQDLWRIMTTALQQTVAAGTWAVDPVHSYAGFRVRHFGLTWLKGGFDAFEATLTSDDGGLKLEGSTPVARITFTNEQLVGHLQSPDFFDAQLHPHLLFRSTQVTFADDGSAIIRGELTMKGVSNEVELRGTWTAGVEDPYGNERVGLELTGEIDRTAWGIAWNAPLPSGGDVLGRTVRLEAGLELVKQ